MFLIRTRRNAHLGNLVRIIGFLIVATTFIDLLRIRHAQTSYVLPSEKDDVHRDTRLFIAATHWNNEAVLRNHWNDAVVNIVEHFGPTNVFVSIYESGSWDDTKGALRLLESRLNELGAGNKIVLDITTHKDELEKRPEKDTPGWIETPRGERELRRIPYLANLRNKVLEPLAKMAEASPPRKFDKILFLNDVYFSVPQLLDLLSTNDGHYAAACALDFSHPPAYYDTFALRDFDGDETVMQVWPYFRSGVSRSALKRHADVPVTSCWNGMVVMDAEPFYDKLSPLRFRGIPDSLATYHLEGSECCLIHADNPFTPSRGVWLNPRVRVGYNEPAYLSVKDNNWLGAFDTLYGLWRNRITRWTTSTWFKKREIQRRLNEYSSSSSSAAKTAAAQKKTTSVKSDDDKSARIGSFCLINEMQVIVENGWAHV